jgi:hypothetical protein
MSQMSQLVNCLKIDEKHPLLILTEDFAKEMGAGGRILFNRLNAVNVTISAAAALFVCHRTMGYPGHIVMWAYTLFKMHSAQQPSGAVIKTVDLVEAFPEGFPTQGAFLYLWRSQKDEEGVNHIDNFANWKA